MQIGHRDLSANRKALKVFEQQRIQMSGKMDKIRISSFYDDDIKEAMA